MPGVLLATQALAPIAVFLLVAGRSPSQVSFGRVQAAVALACLVNGSLLLMHLKRAFPEGVSERVVWAGVLVPTDQRLVLGDRGQNADFGWSGGSAAPVLEIRPQGEETVSLALLRGGAFVELLKQSGECKRAPDSKRSLLGGEALKLGSGVGRGVVPIRDGEMRFELRLREGSGSPGSGVPTLDILAERWAGEPLVLQGSKRFAAERSEKSREPIQAGTRRLGLLLADVRKQLRKESTVENLETLLALNTWARGVLIFEHEGLLFVQEDTWAAADESTEFALPCTVVVRHPGRNEMVRLESRDDLGVGVFFEPPWRTSSPVPPVSLPGQRRAPILVAAAARPGDEVFAIPFGPSSAATRTQLTWEGEAADGAQLRGDGTGRAIAIPSSWTSVRSVAASRVSPHQVLTALVDAAPRVKRLGWLFILAAGLTVSALWLLSKESNMQRSAYWLVGFVAAWLFVVGSIRLLLAVRYAADMSKLDSLGVRGIALAFSGWILLPVVPVLAAWIRNAVTFQSPGVRLRWWWKDTVGVALGLGVLSYGAYRWGLEFWPNVPQSWRRADSKLALAVSLGVACILCAVALMDRKSSRRQGSRRTASPQLYQRLANEVGRRLWIGVAGGESGFVLVTAGGAALLVALGFAMGKRLPEKSAALVALPVIFLALAAFWLSACWIPWPERRPLRGRGPRSGSPLGRILGLTIVIVLAMLSLPLAIGDAGSLYGSLSFLLVLTCILWASGVRRLAWLTTGVVVATVFLALGTVYSLERLPARTDSKVATSLLRTFVHSIPERVLAFRQGSGALRQTMDRESNFSTSLRDAVQHTWVNKAMVHVGGWTGAGFGEAPTRKAEIRQDTLQVDSVYSCYLSGDYGLVGGLAVLALALMPLLAVHLASEGEFRMRLAFGALIGGVFFFETFIHALGNLGYLPFTGRNAPLLAAASASDLFGWMLLFSVFTRTQLWERTPESVSNRNENQPWRSPALALLILGSVGLLGATAAHAGWIFTPELRSFSLGEMLTAAQERLDKEEIYLRLSEEEAPLPKSGEPVPCTTAMLALRDGSQVKEGSSWLSEEVLRFNLLPLERKMGEPERLREALRSVLSSRQVGTVAYGGRALPLEQVASRDALWSALLRSHRASEDFFRSLHALSEAMPISRGPEPLFRLSEVDAGSRAADETSLCRVEVNPRFDHQIHMDPQRPISVQARKVGGASWYLEVGSAHLELESREPRPGEVRRVTVVRNSGSGWRILGDSAPGAPVGQILARNSRVEPPALVGEFEADPSGRGVHFRGGDFSFSRISNGIEQRLTETANARPLLREGESLRVPGIGLTLRLAQSSPRDLVGSAWVNGREVQVVDPSIELPWLKTVAGILTDASRIFGNEAIAAHYGLWTLDARWQGSAQRFTDTVGPELFAKTHALPGAASRDRPTGDWLPPRVALTVLDARTGEVVALGGWPHGTPGRQWQTLPGGQEPTVPPLEWLSEGAPRDVRLRFVGERNFDLLRMGSSTKPLWASAALGVHPGLDRKLVVNNSVDPEKRVFGIQVPGPTWRDSGTSGDGGFEDFLARSSNRYAVRLGFAGLAERRGGSLEAESSARPDAQILKRYVESLDGGRRPWGRFPRFPAELGFGHDSPSLLAGVEGSELLRQMWTRFRLASVRRLGLSRDVTNRLSFWTRNEEDDQRLFEKLWLPEMEVPAGGTETAEDLWVGIPALRYFSPGQANLAANRGFDAAGALRSPTPRDFISVLLGGRTNAWANTEFAAAFLTAITGRPTNAHITEGGVGFAEERPTFQVSDSMLEGLSGVFEYGTAAKAFRRLGGPTWNALVRHPDVSVYGKTGTLVSGDSGDDVQVSRLVMAVVRWKSERRREIDRGIVLSLVAEGSIRRPDLVAGWASEAMARFVSENGRLIDEALGIE